MDAVLQAWAKQIVHVTHIEPTSAKPDGLTMLTAKVTSVHGTTFILKNVGHLSAQQLALEYRLLQHLEINNVPVALPLLTDDGQTFYAHTTDRYVLLPILPIAALEEEHTWDWSRTFYNIGQAIARLHFALVSFPEKVDSWTMNLPHVLTNDAIPQIERALAENELSQFRIRITILMPHLKAALHELPIQLIHGDCHGGNMLLHDQHVSGFIDLDHLPYGPRVYDIGYYLADKAKGQFFYDAPSDWDWLHFDHLIAGYEAISPLTASEKHAIPFMMLATQLMMAYWLYKHDNSEFGDKHLRGFDLIYAHYFI